MHITQEPLHEVVCVLFHFHCICTLLWQQNCDYRYCSFAAKDKLLLQNKDMSVCVCWKQDCLRLLAYSPVASSAINDLAYNISATIMKNLAEAPSPPTYWVQFIKGFMLIADVKLGLNIIECLGNPKPAMSSLEWLSFWTYSSRRDIIRLEIR